MGRQHFDTLPWERGRAAYKARPLCIVEREWARVALKKLRQVLSKVGDDAIVSFQFDGKVLIIQCAEQTVPLPAEGAAWSSQFNLTVAVVLGGLNQPFDLCLRSVRATVRFTVVGVTSRRRALVIYFGLPVS